MRGFAASGFEGGLGPDRFGGRSAIWSPECGEGCPKRRARFDASGKNRWRKRSKRDLADGAANSERHVLIPGRADGGLIGMAQNAEPPP